MIEGSVALPDTDWLGSRSSKKYENPDPEHWYQDIYFFI